MCRKLLFLASFVLVLGLTLTGPARADLVAWWMFDDGSGTTALDSSGNGNNGTLTGDPQWVAGQLGGALDFSGTNSRVTAPHIPLDNRSFTIAMWVNLGQNTSEHIALSQGPGSTNEGLHLRLGGAGNPAAGGINFGFYGNDLVTGGGLLELNTWYHLGFVYDIDDQQQRIYLDGELVGERASTPFLGTTQDTLIGSWNSDQWFEGIIDDVQIYDHVLTENEILAAMRGLEGYPYASKPSPADGAMITETWASMAWSAGDFAVSHNVYFGDNFDDVNDGTGDTFRGNQALNSKYFVAGFPGYAFPEGLVYGETYYWRIDEVNDNDPNSPWKGRVWSFWIQPLKAYDLVPGDGSKFVDSENLILSWTAGKNAVLHTVYFSDNFDDVNDRVGGNQTALKTFTPGPLEVEKTYYWRVDEFTALGTNEGDVLSFTTAKVGGGIRGDYYRGMNFDNFMLSRTDPQIDFSWGDPGGPDATVGDDSFSARWTGEVEAAFTETYRFYTSTDDGARLWVDGQQLVNAWVDQGTTEYSGTIDLVAGNTYSLVMEYYENGGGAVAQLRWSSPSTPKQLIPQAALAPPIKASSPSPYNGATGTKMTPILRWGAGDLAVSHEVYFGADADAVKNATTASPEYKGPKALGDEIYDPGKLAWFTEYFWRVDEVNNLNPESPWVGNLWSFTTGDFIVVDDFEDYNAGDNQIWYSWHDGLGYGAPGTADFFAGNGTGAAVGDETTASYTEETIVHGGSKSMPLVYDNNKQGYSRYSETELKLIAPRDWTEEGVANLSLWFRGYPASTGGFVEGPVGTYTMTSSGTDITGTSDEFHFAYKMLTGAGSIVARIDSQLNTNEYAKAGVMIRETLDADSAHAITVVTPEHGVLFEYRPATGDDNVGSAAQQTGITAPHWVKIERNISGTFTAYSSTNGTTWDTLGTPAQSMSIGTNVYIGLVLTGRNAAETGQAVFSNLTITGAVTGQWTNQDIGIPSNDPEPFYVAVSNSTGTSAVVVHDDANAAQAGTWTEWVIPLQTFADQGIILADVDRIAIGLGTRGNATIPGGSGKMFFDDIRLYQPDPEPEPEPEPAPEPEPEPQP